MSRRTRAGYPAFAKWKEKLTEAKVKNLTGQYGLTPEHLKDLHQELLLHLLVKQQDRDYRKSFHVTEKTFVSRILDNRIRNFLTALTMGRNRMLSDALPLSTPVPLPDGEERATLEDLLPEETPVYGVRHRSVIEDVETRLAIRKLLDDMTPLQRKAAWLFMSHCTTSEAARVLGVHRTTLVREMRRMEKYFSRRGFRMPKK